MKRYIAITFMLLCTITQPATAFSSNILSLPKKALGLIGSSIACIGAYALYKNCGAKTVETYLPKFKQQPDTIIFDLNGVLLETSRANTAKHAISLFWDKLKFSNCSLYTPLGCVKDFIGYIWKYKTVPFRVKHDVFRFLEETYGKQHPPKGDFAARGDGVELPQIMCDWLKGTISGREIIKKTHAEIDRSEAFVNNPIKSSLYKAVIEAMFDPAIHAQHTHPLESGIDVLRRFAQEKDENGDPRYRLLILSNYDPDSFQLIKEKDECKQLFEHFADDNICISGYEDTIKPYDSMYQLFKQQYIIEKHGLSPEQCLFIDDQDVNVKGAENNGIPAYHLKNGNYKALTKQLEKESLLTTRPRKRSYRRR
jgi:FMN phosphatase YigB (HAD superfamily)